MTDGYRVDFTVDHVFRNERHGLDRVTGVRPANHPDNPTGVAQQITVRDELAAGRCFRSDVILVNAIPKERPDHCDTCTCEPGIKQFAIYARLDGSLDGDPTAFRLISADDLRWAEEEAARMVATAAESPEYARAFLR